MSALVDTVKVTGALSIRLYRADGTLKDSRDIPNLVVTTGKQFIASRMAANTTTMSHLAVGSGTTAPTVGDTTLQSELGRGSIVSATTALAVTTYVGTVPAGVGTGAVTEAGIFNAASAGTMLCRTVFAVVNKDVSDTMSVTWLITIS
jgi:hypothetical protein